MRIFIAGPYGDHNSKEVIAQNVARADAVARDLMAMGHWVFCLHKMSWGWEDDGRLTREQHLVNQLTFIHHWAEVIYRIEGDSPGSDGEQKLAEALGLPVFTSYDEVPDGV